MATRRIKFCYKIEIIFLTLFLLYSCASVDKKTGSPLAKGRPFGLRKKAANKTLTDDVLGFLDLKQIDLDNDAQKDIIALYTNTEHLSSVKVIKVRNNQGEVVYKQTIGNRHVKIDVKSGTPVIIIKEAPFIFGNRVLRWNGETFVKERSI
jgi:hypothetical protein